MSKSFELALLFILAVSLVAFLIVSRPEATWAQELGIKNWLCYYGNRYGPDIYSRFDLVVFDGTYHPPLEKKKNGKPIYLGYVSIGEVDKNGPLWYLAKDQPFLLHTNQFWNSRLVDVRDMQWQEILFETAIPAVLNRGFDGLFLDTFDSALSLLYGKDAGKYEDVPKALSDITRKIREKYPDKFIAVNRGLPLLPLIAGQIDFIVAEDLFSFYSDEKMAYVPVDAQTRKILIQQLETGLRVNPKLTVLSLDYAEAHQMKLIKDAIHFSKKRDFIPYVSTVQLDDIFFHALKP